MKPEVHLAGGEFLLLTLILCGVYAVIAYFIGRYRRVNPGKSPMSAREVRKLMRKLPKELRTPTEQVQASYALFEGSRVRFSFRPADDSDPSQPLSPCLRVVIDNKFTLFFYDEAGTGQNWEYDGFEAGDYRTEFTDGLIR